MDLSSFFRFNSVEIRLFCSDSSVLFCEGARGRPISYLDLGVDAEQGEKSVHVYQSLSGLSVHGAQEVEGERELEEQAVHHHQVSHCHRTCRKTTQQLALALLYHAFTFGWKINKKITAKLFFFPLQAEKVDKPSPPPVISISASKPFCILFMPLFHACCALFSFSCYYAVQAEFTLLFPLSSVHLILFWDVWAYLCLNCISKHCCTIITTNHSHEELKFSPSQLRKFSFLTFNTWIQPNLKKLEAHLRHLHTTTQNSTCTHLLRCPGWQAAWWRWGRRWRWRSGRSWAWRAWMSFSKTMTHRSSGIRRTFQLRTFHYWNTAAEMRSIKRQSTGHGDNEKIHKRNERVSRERKRERLKYGNGQRLKKAWRAVSAR